MKVPNVVDFQLLLCGVRLHICFKRAFVNTPDPAYNEIGYIEWPYNKQIFCIKMSNESNEINRSLKE